MWIRTRNQQLPQLVNTQLVFRIAPSSDISGKHRILAYGANDAAVSLGEFGVDNAHCERTFGTIEDALMRKLDYLDLNAIE